MTMRPSAPIMFATRPGGTTIDRDEFGGNPFATALIELHTAGPVSLRQLPRRLRALTLQGSQGHQDPQWTNWPARVSWSLQRQPGLWQEKRCALVLIVSDYTVSGRGSLKGAANDERRVAGMFASNGFTVFQGVAPSRSALLSALINFSRVARTQDAAVIYCTGHGMERSRTTYLLPGDYPFEGGYGAAQLNARAISLDRIAAACRARKHNLVFFAGCRTLATG